MKLPCFITRTGEQAIYLGVDIKKKMYKLRVKSGEVKYVDLLDKLEFRKPPEQIGLLF